jgi:pimeloyl-ACP methyl ester carboxylesterase
MKAVNAAGTFATLTTRDDITPRIDAIKVPTLVVHGDADAAIPLALANVLVQRIGGAQLAVIAGAGRGESDASVPTNTAIERFLAASDPTLNKSDRALRSQPPGAAGRAETSSAHRRIAAMF